MMNEHNYKYFTIKYLPSDLLLCVEVQYELRSVWMSNEKETSCVIPFNVGHCLLALITARLSSVITGDLCVVEIAESLCLFSFCSVICMFEARSSR